MTQVKEEPRQEYFLLYIYEYRIYLVIGVCI